MSSSSSVTPKYVRIETDLVANLIESCDNNNPTWLDESGKVVGIIARIWDQIVYWIGLLFKKEVSKIEDNFVSLCSELGKNGSSDEREINPVILDLITLKRHDQKLFIQVTNTIYTVASRVLLDPNQKACDGYLRTMARQLALADLDVITVPKNIQLEERSPGALFNLNHNTCFAVAAIQFLVGNPLFSRLLHQPVTRKAEENFTHFLIREEIQQNLRGLLEVMQQEVEDKRLRNEQVFIYLYLVLQRIRFLSHEYPRPELRILEAQEDIHDYLIFLFEILQCENQPDYTFFTANRYQVKREAGDGQPENFMFTQPVQMQQPFLSIGENLGQLAECYGTRLLPIMPARIKIKDLIRIYFSSWEGAGQMRFEKWETAENPRVIRPIERRREFLIAPPTEDEDQPVFPPHLIFHINRFSHNGIKDTTYVDLGLDRPSNLDVDPEPTNIELFFHDQAPPHRRKYKVTYQLMTLACHLGETQRRGHYYALAQRGDHPMIINDTIIRKQTKRDAQRIGNDVYLVLYKFLRFERVEEEEDQTEAFYREIQEDYQMIYKTHADERAIARVETFLSNPANRKGLSALLENVQATGMTLDQYFQLKAPLSTDLGL